MAKDQTLLNEHVRFPQLPIFLPKPPRVLDLGKALEMVSKGILGKAGWQRAPRLGIEKQATRLLKDLFPVVHHVVV